MWEFSINVASENARLAKFIYNELQGAVEELGGVITSFESGGEISVVLACELVERPRLEYHITNTLSIAVCTFFKEQFLDDRLKLPNKNNLEIFTFRKALISFDRETDRFLVSKFLTLNNSINLESFFYFRLNTLKEKWGELVCIANDNSTYLLGDDSFIELLKFLIDNIDVATDQVFVDITPNKVCVVDENQKSLIKNPSPSLFDLVDFLLQNSPRKIHWHSEMPELFLEKIFAKRIVYDKPLKNLKAVEET